MKYLDYDKSKIKWKGKSPINKTFLIAPLGPKSPIMIFNSSGQLLLSKKTEGFPSHFVQLTDLSGYSYFSGTQQVGPKQAKNLCANGRYTLGKLYITNNNLETQKIIDYIPTPKIPKVIGLHMHGNYVLGKNHYLLQAISFEEVEIHNKKSYVVNNILQEQLNGEVIWEWQTIDEPCLFDASFARNKYFESAALKKECACDYAHMNSVIKTSDNRYMYISFKHIGIVKIDYYSKEIIWILGTNRQDLKFPKNSKMFSHQHDLHLINDNTIYFWDNKNFSYVEMSFNNTEVINYNTFNCPTKCWNAVMGNAIKVSDTIIDICYGMRRPLTISSIYSQPSISEFNIQTGEKILDITINDCSPELVNIMYQVNRGVNIYEN